MNWLGNMVSDAKPPESAAWSLDALLLDVRSCAEYAAGHVQGALNLPLDCFVRDHAALAPDKSRQIVVYCQSGGRSGQAMRYLVQQGYGNVVNGGSAGAVGQKFAANSALRAQ